MFVTIIPLTLHLVKQYYYETVYMKNKAIFTGFWLIFIKYKMIKY